MPNNPSELAIKERQTTQNISSYYLKRLIEAKAVELIEARGRQRFYAVVPQVHWWKLEKKPKNRNRRKKLTEQTKNRLKDIQKKLIE